MHKNFPDITSTERFPITDILATEVIDASGRPCLELQAVLDAEVCRSWPWCDEWCFDPVTGTRLAPKIRVKVPTDYNESFSLTSDTTDPKSGLSGRSQFILQSVCEDLNDFVNLQSCSADAVINVSPTDALSTRQQEAAPNSPKRPPIDSYFSLVLDRVKYHKTKQSHLPKHLMNPTLLASAVGDASKATKCHDWSVLTQKHTDNSRVDDTLYLSERLLSIDEMCPYDRYDGEYFLSPTRVQLSPLTMTKGSGAKVHNKNDVGGAKNIGELRFFDYLLLAMALQGRGADNGFATSSTLPVSSHAVLGISMLLAKVSAASCNLFLFEHLSVKYIKEVLHVINRPENDKFRDSKDGERGRPIKKSPLDTRCFRVDVKPNLTPPSHKPNMPIPLVAVFGGGAGSNWPFRELLLAPVLVNSVQEAVRLNIEVCQQVKIMLEDQYGPDVSCYVNDNGAWCPPLLDVMEPFAIVNHAIRIVEGRIYQEAREKGNSGPVKMALVLDAGASRFYCPNRGGYLMTDRCPEVTDHVVLNAWELSALYRKWIPEFNLIAIIDPFDHNHTLCPSEISAASQVSSTPSALGAADRWRRRRASFLGSPLRRPSSLSPTSPGRRSSVSRRGSVGGPLVLPPRPPGAEDRFQNIFLTVLRNLLSFYATCIAPDKSAEMSSAGSPIFANSSKLGQTFRSFGDALSGVFSADAERTKMKSLTLACVRASINSHYDVYTSHLKQKKWRERVATDDPPVDDDEEFFLSFLCNVATLWILDYYSNSNVFEYSTSRDVAATETRTEQLMRLLQFLQDLLLHNKIDMFNKEGAGCYYGDENDNCYYPERAASDFNQLNLGPETTSDLHHLTNINVGELLNVLELYHYIIRGGAGVSRQKVESIQDRDSTSDVEESTDKGNVENKIHAGQQAAAWAALSASAIEKLDCFCIADDLLYQKNKPERSKSSDAELQKRTSIVTHVEDHLRQTIDADTLYKIPSDVFESFKSKPTQHHFRRHWMSHASSVGSAPYTTTLSQPPRDALSELPDAAKVDDSVMVPSVQGNAQQTTSLCGSPISPNLVGRLEAPRFGALDNAMLGVDHIGHTIAGLSEKTKAMASRSQMAALTDTSFIKKLENAVQTEAGHNEGQVIQHYIRGPMCTGVALRLGVGAVCRDGKAPNVSTAANVSTVSTAFEMAASCHILNKPVIVSQCRGGGESEDTFLAHLAVGLHSGLVRLGGINRAETTSKMNELIRIEHYLGVDNGARYGNADWQKRYSDRLSRAKVRRRSSRKYFGQSLQNDIEVDLIQGK